MSNPIRGTSRTWIAITTSRCASVAILLSFFGISAYGESIRTDTTVTTSGFVLMVDGKPFAIKGMNYAPVPIGVVPESAPYGDYFTSNFANVWKSDIDKMRAAGVNAIKLYAGDPAVNAGAPGSGGNWKAFLNYLWNNGNNPIYVIMFSYTQGGVIANGTSTNPKLENDVKLYKSYLANYEKLVKSTVNFPAVLGYMIGNEIFDSVTGRPEFWVNFANLVNTANSAGISQGKKPFLTTGVTDVVGYWPAVELGEKSGLLTNLDAWSINIYRGPHMGGSGDSPFKTYASLVKTLGIKKPMILGEWGTPHTTRPVPIYGEAVRRPCINLDDLAPNDIGPNRPYFDAMETGPFLTGLWNIITANIGANAAQVCVGGFIFEWNDEYYKAGPGFQSEQVGNEAWVGGSLAGSYYDEAGFGVTGDVPASAYGAGKPNITRLLFKGYQAVKVFYNASSHSGGELY